MLKIDPDGRSGEVAINKEKKTLTISVNLKFYGNGNCQLAEQTARDVQERYNAAAGSVTIDNVQYAVTFEVTGDYREGISQSEIESNKSYANNYYRILSNVTPGASPGITHQMTRSEHLGGNTGYVREGELTNNSKTMEHELGHSFGLLKVADGGGIDGHPLSSRGNPWTREPRIVLPRGTFVGIESFNAAGNTPFLDLTKRKVTQADIGALHLDKLNFDKNGKANLGDLTNFKVNSDGTVVR